MFSRRTGTRFSRGRVAASGGGPAPILFSGDQTVGAATQTGAATNEYFLRIGEAHDPWGNNTSESPSTFTTNVAIAAGELLVLSVAVDNQLGPGDGLSNTVTGVTIDGDAMTKAHEYTTPSAGANAAACIAQFWLTAADAIASGSTVSITFAAARTGKAAVLTRFMKPAGTVVVDGLSQSSGTAEDPPSLATTGSTNAHSLIVRASAMEGANTGNWTPTASWSASAASIGGGTGASGMCARTESITVNATNATSDPSGPQSVDHASIGVRYRIS